MLIEVKYESTYDLIIQIFHILTLKLKNINFYHNRKLRLYLYAVKFHSYINNKCRKNRCLLYIS